MSWRSKAHKVSGCWYGHWHWKTLLFVFWVPGHGNGFLEARQYPPHLGSRQIGPEAQLSAPKNLTEGPNLSTSCCNRMGSWQIGPWTVGPQVPIVQVPTVCVCPKKWTIGSNLPRTELNYYNITSVQEGIIIIRISVLFSNPDNR